jgi:hypothetical protein
MSSKYIISFEITTAADPSDVLELAADNAEALAGDVYDMTDFHARVDTDTVCVAYVEVQGETLPQEGMDKAVTAECLNGPSEFDLN